MSLSNLPATGTQNFNSAVRTVLNEWKESIEGKASATHTHDGGSPSLHKIVANEANLGTGAQDGELAICTDNGNCYTWDAGNSKWRIMPGNIYSSDPSSSTYTIETGTTAMISGVYKRWDGTAFVPVAPPSDLIQGGVISNNAADPDHDIDIAPIGCWDSNREVWMETDSTVTIAIDASGLNGLDTGIVAADTIFHLYIVYNPTTGDTGFVFSADANSPTLPSGYTKYRHIEAYVWTDPSGNIIPFRMRGDVIRFINADDVVSITGITNTTYAQNDFSSYLPTDHYDMICFGAKATGSSGVRVFFSADGVNNLGQIYAQLNTSGTHKSAWGYVGNDTDNESFFPLDDDKIYLKVETSYPAAVLIRAVKMRNR